MTTHPYALMYVTLLGNVYTFAVRVSAAAAWIERAVSTHSRGCFVSLTVLDGRTP